MNDFDHEKLVDLMKKNGEWSDEDEQGDLAQQYGEEDDEEEKEG